MKAHPSAFTPEMAEIDKTVQLPRFLRQYVLHQAHSPIMY